MRERAFVFAAYHGTMDFILLFFLFAANNNPQLHEQLRSFLAFYRENRDLFALLTQNKAPMPVTEVHETPQETRPQSSVGSEKVLEEFLSRLS